MRGPEENWGGIGMKREEKTYGVLREKDVPNSKCEIG